MDPMSAAAAIVGLLGAAATVLAVLFKSIGNVKEAPKLEQNVLMEVSDVSACLNQLQRYIQFARAITQSRATGGYPVQQRLDIFRTLGDGRLPVAGAADAAVEAGSMAVQGVDYICADDPNAAI